MAARKTTSTRTTRAKTADVITDDNSSTVEAVTQKYKVRTVIDPNTLVPVYNGFNGMMVYEDKRTGELWRWEEFGTVQEMTFQELKGARNASKAFFANNWFMFDDPEIIEALGVEAYYKHALTLEGFDELFQKSPAQVADIIAELSDGQKKSVKYMAKQKINDGEIDSIKMIDALEKALECELIER